MGGWENFLSSEGLALSAGDAVLTGTKSLSSAVREVVVAWRGESLADEASDVEGSDEEGDTPPLLSTRLSSLSDHCTVYLFTRFTSELTKPASSVDTEAPCPAPLRASSFLASRGLASPAACTLKARRGPGGGAEGVSVAERGEKLWARCTPVFLPADTRTALMMLECCGSDSFLKVLRVVTGGGGAS